MMVSWKKKSDRQSTSILVDLLFTIATVLYCLSTKRMFGAQFWGFVYAYHKRQNKRPQCKDQNGCAYWNPILYSETSIAPNIISSQPWFWNPGSGWNCPYLYWISRLKCIQEGVAVPCLCQISCCMCGMKSGMNMGNSNPCPSCRLYNETCTERPH